MKKWKVELVCSLTNALANLVGGQGCMLDPGLIHNGWIWIEVTEPHTSASLTGVGCPYTQLLIQYLFLSVLEFSSATCLNPIRNLCNLSLKYHINPFTFLIFYCNYSSSSSLNSYKVILFGLRMSTWTLLSVDYIVYFQIWFFYCYLLSLSDTHPFRDLILLF